MRMSMALAALLLTSTILADQPAATSALTKEERLARRKEASAKRIAMSGG